MPVTTSGRRRSLALVPLLAAALAASFAPAVTPTAQAAAPAAAAVALPDPMARGDYAPLTIQETKLGSRRPPGAQLLR